MDGRSNSIEAEGGRIPVLEIQKRIAERKARVYTAKEFKDLVRKGERPALGEVDAVTVGSFGIVSGTMAVFCIPLCGPAEFKHAVALTMNGVPASVGPCPNESLGMVDCIVNGTAERDASYGGGHLFRDLVAGNPVEIVAATDDGREIRKTMTLSEIPFARMITTRSFFKNYNCFATADGDVTTIFSGPNPMEGGWRMATFSGCGEISPLQNDPELRYLHTGAGVFVNGAPGIVLGTGTRSNAAKPNLSVEADMHLMRPEYMGGFRTSIGPECTISVGAVIPVVDQRTLDDLSIVDADTELPLNDVRDRKPISMDRYASVWNDHNLVVKADLSKCRGGCGDDCEADAHCPRDAHPSKGIDRSLCMECGNCVTYCASHAFSCDLGSVHYNVAGREFDVPVRQRQSCRRIGQRVCEDLKRRVEDGSWSLGLFNEYAQRSALHAPLRRIRCGRRGALHPLMPRSSEEPAQSGLCRPADRSQGHRERVPVHGLAACGRCAAGQGPPGGVQERGPVEGDRGR